MFVLRYIVNPYELTKPRIDAMSCVLSVFGFGGLVIGAGMASLYGWLSVACLGSLVVGTVCLIFYVRRQLVLESPVLNMRVFNIRGFTIGTLCVMLAFGITMSSMYLMPQFVQRGMLIAVAVTGLLLLPGGCVNAIFSLIGGRLYDRMGARGPVLCGFALVLVGVALLLTTDENTSIAFLILCHVV